MDKIYKEEAFFKKNIRKHSNKKSFSRKSVLNNMPKNLSSIRYSQEVTRRMMHVGFKWENINQVISKVKEELEEVEECIRGNKKENIEEELGDLILATIILCTYLGQDAEKALNSASQKFKKRFYKVEQQFEEQNKKIKDATLKEIRDAWKKAKAGK